jgi:uncharacterized damage-inducible protein DinB
MPPQQHPVISNIKFLNDGAALIRRLDREMFNGASELVPGGTVGSHFRHCLDFYVSFLRGLEVGEVDYDRRDRTPEWEAIPERILEAMNRIVHDLETLAQEDPKRPLQVRGDSPLEEGQDWARSSTGRELQYLLSHTIHHYAIIGTILRSLGIEPGMDFGVAPSTLRHWGKAGGVAS